MKVILSRKGCDSDFGGMPGIIMPDDRIVYIPIPGDDFETIAYHEVNAGNGLGNLCDVISQVSVHMKMYGKKLEINPETKCHLDPDLDAGMYPRKSGWRGCFGQADAAQTVLKKAGVAEGDLFLFFGWFNRTCYKDGKLRFCKGQGIHMIFGWLQIEKVIYTHEMPVPEWMEYHPHAIQRRLDRPSNCIYTGKERLSWNPAIRGYGVFPRAGDALVLTKKGYSRSRWELPASLKGIPITYHKAASWKKDYFQSACRGQEFVFEEHKAVEKWARGLIESAYCEVRHG